jgi:hypothetical protein
MFFYATPTSCLDDWKLIDVELDAGVELDATEWRTALVDKVACVVENAATGGWPGGEEGWRAAALERGGE